MIGFGPSKCMIGYRISSVCVRLEDDRLVSYDRNVPFTCWFLRIPIGRGQGNWGVPRRGSFKTELVDGTLLTARSGHAFEKALGLIIATRDGALWRLKSGTSKLPRHVSSAFDRFRPAIAIHLLDMWSSYSRRDLDQRRRTSAERAKLPEFTGIASDSTGTSWDLESLFAIGCICLLFVSA